ncbi:MAG: hypothetical protein OES25_09055 [Acidobacteriota bacterium]|nr:hypothetical protein [Acidobacteriota bacterium]
MAQSFVTLLQAYLAVGVLFGLWFVFRAVKRLDPAANEGGLGFRLLILPGVAALWPFLLGRIVRGGPPVERNPHRDRVQGDGS